MNKTDELEHKPVTLTIDIGGQGIKARAYEGSDIALGERVRIKTPRPASPDAVFEVLCHMLDTMRPYDRVSVGFPGVVAGGISRTAPNLDGTWDGFRIQEKLVERARVPVIVVNDADLQGYGAIQGRGVEMIITLGTGVGSGLYVDGRVVPNLELGHHPFEKGETYEQRLGQAALDKLGKPRWLKRVWRAVELLRRIFNFNSLYVGGGNGRLVTGKTPSDVIVVKNAIAFQGGARLWEILQ